MESRIDRHVESGRVPDTGATWPIKTMPFLHSSSQVDDKSRRAFDVSRSAIGRRMINRDRRGSDPVCFRTDFISCFLSCLAEFSKGGMFDGFGYCPVDY